MLLSHFSNKSDTIKYYSMSLNIRLLRTTISLLLKNNKSDIHITNLLLLFTNKSNTSYYLLKLLLLFSNKRDAIIIQLH